MPRASPGGEPHRRPKLLFLATEDWYFWSDRLPSARALRDAGCDIVVAGREQAHGERIRAERFRLHPLPWRRRRDGIFGLIRGLAAIVRLYRRERPDIVNHLALKPMLLGGIARRWAYSFCRAQPASIDWLMGFGIGFIGQTWAARLKRRLLGLALRITAGGADRIVVQNPDDADLLAGLGVDRERIALIRGSGVDTVRFTPLPMPDETPVCVALVARMLRSKGVPEAVAAVRRLRRQGLPIELVLAGGTDPDNRDSLDDRELAAMAAEPGIEWLGRVEDVSGVWRRAAIAVLPSTYGEGLPRTLLEAAACGRPIVASDTPGCREALHHGETGLLVPPGDIDALAEALAALAADPARRRAMGRAGRELVEREFSEARIVGETLALYEAVLAARAAAR